MKRKATNKNLHRKAEELIKNRPPEAISLYTEAKKLMLIHEPKVHKIEMELMNEEYVQEKEQAGLNAKKITELCASALSGYLTFYFTLAYKTIPVEKTTV